jgi:hypothetical protein
VAAGGRRHGWGNKELQYYTDSTENAALDGAATAEQAKEVQHDWEYDDEEDHQGQPE